MAAGVMVHPKMTEGYFANDIQEEEFSSDNGATTFIRPKQTIHLKYLLVLSEGCLPLVQIRDLYFGGCRKGTFHQACNGRAGTWTPGNDWDEYLAGTIQPDSAGYYPISFATINPGQAKRAGDFIYYKDTDGASVGSQHVLPYIENNFPTFCGTSGSYDGLTTLSFEYETELKEGGDPRNAMRSIGLFVRNGLSVTRLVDGVTNESDNYVDLAKYLFQSGNRLTDDLIDNSSLTASAKFTDANGFLFNGVLTQSQNLSDWLQATSPNFLLRLTNTGGKFGLIPRLPYNTDFTIKTTAIVPRITFTEEHILDNGFQAEYISLEDREPVCFVVQWRQQDEGAYGIVRTVEVRYEGEAADGPFLDIDMSGYCTNEDHAVKLGMFRLAQRKFITHHLRLTVRERNYNSHLVVGDLVRVRLRRETNEGEVGYHDKVYEINRIDKTFESKIIYDLTHFPIDSQGRSLIARAVDSASGAGNLIDVGESDVNCDENSSTGNDTVGTDEGGGGTPPDSGDTAIDIPQPDDDDSPFPDGPDLDNQPEDELVPEDPIDQPFNGSIGGYNGDAGDTLNFTPGCANPQITWYKVDPVTGEKIIIKGPGIGTTLDVVEALEANAQMIYAEGCCPDPSTPTAYPICVESEELDISDIFDEIEDCPGGGDAGGQGGSTKVIDVGTAYPASFTFTWTAYTIRDRFIISGAASYDTGFVSGTNVAVTVQKTSANRYITVQVQAPTAGTAWNYQVGCAS